MKLGRPTLAAAAALLLGAALLAPRARAQQDTSEYDKLDEETKKLIHGIEDELKKANDIVDQLSKPQHTWDEAIKIFHDQIAALEKLPKVSADFKKRNQINPYYNAACAYAKSGRKAEAIKDLAKSIECGYHDWKHVDEDKDFDAIRNDADFKATLDKGKAGDKARVEKERTKFADDTKKALAGAPLFELFDFEQETIGGKSFKLAEKKGKVVVVSVWATWSDDSAAMLPDLQKLHDTWKDKGIELIGFADEGTRDEADKYVQSWAEQKKINFPLATIDRDGRIYQSIPEMSNRAIPVTIFLDKQGKVRVRKNGRLKYDAIEAIAQTLLEAN
jgi:thiol-disulfide isomerase/thioredoxin